VGVWWRPRDPGARAVRLNRDARGILRSIDATKQRIAFEYDDRRRIIRATQAKHLASYLYDTPGGGPFTYGITVFCTNGGRHVSETADIDPGDEPREKADLIRRVCD